MKQVSKLPPVLVSWLESADLTWYSVWKPLQKAIDKNQAIDCEGNLMNFSYEPKADLFTVSTIFGDVPEVLLSKDDFIREIKKYTRGAPSC